MDVAGDPAEDAGGMATPLATPLATAVQIAFAYDLITKSSPSRLT